MLDLIFRLVMSILILAGGIVLIVTESQADLGLIMCTAVVTFWLGTYVKPPALPEKPTDA
jgi:hypothetical protein